MPTLKLPLSVSDLSSLLLDARLLTQEQLNLVAHQAAENETTFYEVLVHSGLIADENIGKLVADHFQLPFVHLGKRALDRELVHTISQTVAREHQVLLFELTEESVSLATAKPQDKAFFETIAQQLGKEVKLFFATPLDLNDALLSYQPPLADSLKQLLTSNQSSGLPISQVVQKIIEAGYREKASDIHLEASSEYSIVRFRIDGVLQDIVKLPKTMHPQIVNRIKVLSRLRTDEHFSAQDGRMHFMTEQEPIDIRVSIVPYVKGEKVVMRLLSSNVRQYTLETLGLNAKDLARLQQAIEKPYGMILSTGPTGSGKTTTMYTLMKIVNTRDKHIATIEDPVEYQIEGINQIQVNPKTNLTFSQGLRSILRQDPDIMYVGEIRDKETAEIAVNAATTGHLLFSTLHTNDAATTLPRLSDMEVEPFLIVSTINIIIGQRLVRTICEKCKASVSVPSDQLSDVFPKQLIKKYFGQGKELQAFQGKGCQDCHYTGYLGRVGIFEVLEMSEALRRLVISRADSAQISQAAVEAGMTTMLEDGIDKVQRGVTTFEEVTRSVKV